MLKIMKEKWAKNESVLKESIANIPDVHSISYNDLVKMAFEKIYNHDNEFCITDLDCDNIVEIDHGEYQGTLIYVIPFDTYQPGPGDYLMTNVYYGSCCGCDTLQGIQSMGYDYSVHKPDDKQISELMSLCRDIIMNTIKPYNYGWRHNDKFDQVEFEEEELN